MAAENREAVDSPLSATNRLIDPTLSTGQATLAHADVHPHKEHTVYLPSRPLRPPVVLFVSPSPYSIGHAGIKSSTSSINRIVSFRATTIFW